MKSWITGVALAAVMACGWASGAEAYPVKLTFSGVASGGVTTRDIFSTQYEETSFSNKTFVIQSFFDSNDLGVTSYGIGLLSIKGEYDTSLDIGNIYTLDSPQFFKSYTELGHRIEGIPDNVYYDTYNVDFTFNDVRLNLLVDGPEVINNPVTLNAGYSFDVTSLEGVEVQTYASFRVDQIMLSSVPLPSSAALFGAAMILLCGTSFGLRRRKAAEAAQA